MRVRLIAVGKLKTSPLLSLFQEYQKRLSWPFKLDEIDAPPASTKERIRILLHKKLDTDNFYVALDERGESLTSQNFAKHMSKWNTRTTGKEIVFVIGGADGFDDETRAKAGFLLSFGKQTWPHMLARCMLIEQIYRAQQILSGHPYHRE